MKEEKKRKWMITKGEAYVLTVTGCYHGMALGISPISSTDSPRTFFFFERYLGGRVSGREQSGCRLVTLIPTQNYS